MPIKGRFKIVGLRFVPSDAMLVELAPERDGNLDWSPPVEPFSAPQPKGKIELEITDHRVAAEMKMGRVLFVGLAPVQD